MKTIGEKRVNVDFNPDNNDLVHEINTKHAELINLVNSLIEPGERSNKARLVTESMTLLETSSMYAVKAVFEQE